ncbi:(2,3-dihydroxybenzoyl)adenylate synthase [Natrinema salifodinae]|uniref:2,3-dihydroxybenzoate-AMP ligase/mycobactin salicyl-AMP ligase n=1 Tax=Natrinema salifodinae TaxID=1202768 RepID=A0A1I0LZ27_9EURY|nr:AMP-binding protein [Natrinema salifodinae]SEV80519.1 2,3-dihydroxybenzoate-AMP ligase/mycobactin salicyl-AMP ligase [Natrinema salifodinae]
MVEGETIDTASLDGYVPFDSERQQAYIDAGYWRNITFHDVVDRHAEEIPDYTALVGPHRELTYAELAANSRRIAAYFVGELGLRPNERVVLQLPNCTEFLEAFVACSRVGVIPVMVLPRHRSAEANHVVDLTDARAYVVDYGRYSSGFDFVGLADDVRSSHESLEHLIAVTDGETSSVDGCDAFAEMRDERWVDKYGDEVSKTDVDPSKPGVMLLSGGTTGLPKAIPRTHNEYVFQWERMADAADVRDDWVAFPGVPIGHNASLNCIVGAALWAGATVAVEPELKPDALMAFIERVGGNYTLPMPTQILDILEHPDLDQYDLSSLEVLVSGGQKVPPRVVEEAVDRWNVGFCNIFGMAEGPLICTRPGDDVKVQANTVGRPIAPEADEIRIVETDRETEVPPGEAGELAVRGPGYFTGYFRNEKENTENFSDDGWFFTEDVLARRDDGNLEVYGRIKDTIIRGGENIYAPGIEDELVEHSKIANAALIGMPDDRLGERPAAFVELTDDATELPLKDVSSFLEERGIAVFKRPEYLEILESLPRTEVGKIEKQALKDRIVDAESK